LRALQADKTVLYVKGRLFSRSVSFPPRPGSDVLLSLSLAVIWAPARLSRRHPLNFQLFLSSHSTLSSYAFLSLMLLFERPALLESIERFFFPPVLFCNAKFLTSCGARRRRPLLPKAPVWFAYGPHWAVRDSALPGTHTFLTLKMLYDAPDSPPSDFLTSRCVHAASSVMILPCLSCPPRNYLPPNKPPRRGCCLFLMYFRVFPTFTFYAWSESLNVHWSLFPFF